MFEELSGKTAFITGAASGMGRAAAIRLGELGVQVAVIARNESGGKETVESVQRAGGVAKYFHCDVTNQKEVQEAIRQTVAEFGTLDFAFNNAGCGADGVHIPFVPLTEVTQEEWKKVIDTNLTGLFYCLQEELIQMKKQGGGSIVNTASIGGLKMAPMFGAYGPSKAAVIAITQTAAIENAKGNIRVNAICPGPTTGTNLMEASESSGAQDTEFLLDHVIPMGKLGTTSDICDALTFLFSSMSGNITGVALPVCGGMQM